MESSNDETLLSGLYILKAVDYCWDDFQEPECLFGKAQLAQTCLYIMDFVCLRKFDQKLPAYSISLTGLIFVATILHASRLQSVVHAKWQTRSKKHLTHFVESQLKLFGKACLNIMSYCSLAFLRILLTHSSARLPSPYRLCKNRMAIRCWCLSWRIEGIPLSVIHFRNAF